MFLKDKIISNNYTLKKSKHNFSKDKIQPC